MLAIASSLSFLFFYHHLPAATTADWADAGLHIQSVLSSRGIYLYSSRDKFIISFIPVKICSFLFHRDLSDHPSSELYQSRQNRPSCEKKWANKTNPTVLAFWKKEMGFFFFREKSWYPSDKSTIEMLMDVAALFLGALVFPMKPIHPSIDGGRNYRLSLIRCARCQVSKRWKVPRHRPPPIPIIFLSSSSALLLRKCWIYNTVATSFFSAKYSNVQI